MSGMHYSVAAAINNIILQSIMRTHNVGISIVTRLVDEVLYRRFRCSQDLSLMYES